jgi:molybdate transport system substrate-binding protein
MKTKVRTQPGGLVAELVARGEAELAVQQIPELMAVPGVDIVGPLPAELQLTTIVAAGVFVNAKHPEATRALLSFLCAPAATSVFKAKGLEPA